MFWWFWIIPFSNGCRTVNTINSLLKQSGTTFWRCTGLGVRHCLSACLQDIRNTQHSKLTCKNEWTYFLHTQVSARRNFTVCRKFSLLYLSSYPNLIKTDFWHISTFIRLLDPLGCSWAENELSLLRCLPELDLYEPGAPLSPAKSAVPFCCFLLHQTLRKYGRFSLHECQANLWKPNNIM